MLRWVFFIGGLLLVDLYAFQTVRTLSKNRWLWLVYWLLSVGSILQLFYHLTQYDSSRGLQPSQMFSIGLFIALFVPKLPMLMVLFGEDVYRLLRALAHCFSPAEERPFFAQRRAVISKLALGMAALPFSAILHGMFRGKYNYRIIEHTLYFDDLPPAFDGFTLTHISDIHSGSFDNASKIAHGIDLINAQDADLILFTGDLVNNTADEMEPWIPYFKKLRSRYGNYSVLGNHDYGDYIAWKSPEEKVANFEAIKAIHPKIGFQLLCNEHVFIDKDGQQLALIGVENWGLRFKKAGDLSAASKGLKKSDFKILMSHDPSHWNAQVKDHQAHYQLTLSGHTHGMQFGIEIPGIQWSPVQYVYKQWAGIYTSFSRYLNVNRGFGFLAFPGRVGIWPEISVITLKRGAKGIF